MRKGMRVGDKEEEEEEEEEAMRKGMRVVTWTWREQQ